VSCLYIFLKLFGKKGKKEGGGESVGEEKGTGKVEAGDVRSYSLCKNEILLPKSRGVQGKRGRKGSVPWARGRAGIKDGLREGGQWEVFSTTNLET